MSTFESLLADFLTPKEAAAELKVCQADTGPLAEVG